MAVQDDSPFSDDELTLHGFHDDRRVLLLQAASSIAAGLLSNPMIASQSINGSKDERQLVADCALDIALKIAARIDDKPDGGQES